VLSCVALSMLCNMSLSLWCAGVELGGVVDGKVKVKEGRVVPMGWER